MRTAACVTDGATDDGLAAGLCELEAAFAAADWHRAASILGATLEGLASSASVRTLPASNLHELLHRFAALREQALEQRGLTETALRELRRGQRAVRAYR